MENTFQPVETALAPGDPSNPRNWPLWKRVTGSVLSITGALSLTSANSIYVTAIPDVQLEFRKSLTKAIVPVTLFTIGLALGPIVSASISEVYGRRQVYLIAFLGSIAFMAVAGSASNWITLAMGRLFAGMLGGPLVAIVAGTLNDIWDPARDSLGNAFFALFAASLIWGTEVGPAIGQSIIDDTNTWRWTFWLPTIMLGVSCLFLLFPETYAPEIARKQLRRQGKQVLPRPSAAQAAKLAVGRPLHMLIVEPIIAPTSFISSIALCVVFFFYIAFPMVFEQLYGFTQYETGLAFLSLFVGSVLGLVFMAGVNKVKHRKSQHLLDEYGVTMQPEELLIPAMVGGVLLPVSLFWFAWTAYSDIHWVVPLLAGIPFGAAYFLVMLGWPLYKNAVYGPQFGASALAAEGLMRYGLAAVVPLFSEPMVRNLGVHWAVSVAGFISLALVPVPWVVLKVGPGLRKRSRYVPSSPDTSPRSSDVGLVTSNVSIKSEA